MLIVDQLTKRLGGRRAVDEVSLSCSAGEVLIVEGPNGAGKSTLLRMIAGVLEPDRGRVTVDGESIVGMRSGPRHLIGYVPEAADPPAHLTVGEVLALVSSLKGVPGTAAGDRERLGIEAITGKQVGTLSLGERRRACLAAALVGQPKLLVLDEPSNGLDAGAVAILAQIVGERAAAGAASIVATHDRQLAAQIGDRTVTMRAGRIYEASAG